MSAESHPPMRPINEAPVVSGDIPETTGEAAPARKRSNPWLVAALLLFLGGMGVLIWWESRPNAPDGPPLAYYTVDEGKTLFADSAAALPPFDYGGRPAVRARVFSCDGGKTRSVRYLEKLPDEAFTTLRAEGKDPYKTDDDDIAERFGWSVKLPGEARWVNSLKDTTDFKRITSVTCPEGREAVPVGPTPDEWIGRRKR